MMPLMFFIMNSVSVLIIWVGAGQVDNGSIQVGGLMAFIAYTMQIIFSFLMLTMISVMVPRAIVSGRRISEVLKVEPSVTDPKRPIEFKADAPAQVEFKDVSFKYPGAEENVLSNISFTAQPGKTTAIIGGTGSGKSTLINLIPRFFDVTSGQILVAGEDVTTVQLDKLRQKIGYVPQKGMLFSGTIKSNIAYGGSNITQEEIETAAAVAQADDFIEQKTDKYDSEIAQGGTNVSGGQRQRLSIARAIAKNPDIYIFDDSFSALDFKTDSALRAALQEHTGGSTVLIVAQRISTVLNADQIIVLNNGEIAGLGTHKELLQSCEVYKEIAESQLSENELRGQHNG
jgi:ATP-binding cassette subfamily B protein